MPLGSAQMGAGVREGGKKKGYIVVSKAMPPKIFENVLPIQDRVDVIRHQIITAENGTDKISTAIKLRRSKHALSAASSREAHQAEANSFKLSEISGMNLKALRYFEHGMSLRLGWLAVLTGLTRRGKMKFHKTRYELGNDDANTTCGMNQIHQGLMIRTVVSNSLGCLARGWQGGQGRYSFGWAQRSLYPDSSTTNLDGLRCNSRQGSPSARCRGLPRYRTALSFAARTFWQPAPGNPARFNGSDYNEPGNTLDLINVSYVAFLRLTLVDLKWVAFFGVAMNYVLIPRLGCLAGVIMRFGGPILYRFVYGFVLFGVLEWVDSGSR
ncbi:hypothetical protein BD769DRAFT_1395732 [Suillus cothurnatus]|nr:hypothetical protein BD769DRAFT_1395732 [Suillus cothurnatus]